MTVQKRDTDSTTMCLKITKHIKLLYALVNTNAFNLLARDPEMRG